MFRYHMVVVTADKDVKRAVRRLTTAAGASAVFVQHEQEFAWDTPIDLVVFDARVLDPDPGFIQRLPSDAHLLYIVEAGELGRKMHLFTNTQTTSLFCYNDQFDDDEFISAATKALRGDVFGLQKYFPWGVTSFTVLVRSYEDKTKAIDIIMSYAQMAGVRAPVRDRMQLVADELMMNALYHAPTDAHGNERYAGYTQKQLAQVPEVDPIEVQYGCSGSYFGISVRDGFGSLSRAKALDYLRRAGTEDARIETKAEGAGLGLINVVQSVSKLIFNLDPGHSTEAIGLFDMQLQSRGIVGARSLHIFTSAQFVNNDVAIPPSPHTPQASQRSWILVAALAAIALALGVGLAMKSRSPTSAAKTMPPTLDAKSVTVHCTPADAKIEINGNAIRSGAPAAMPEGLASITIEVGKKGFDSWSKTIPESALTEQSTFYVELVPTRQDTP